MRSAGVRGRRSVGIAWSSVVAPALLLAILWAAPAHAERTTLQQRLGPGVEYSTDRGKTWSNANPMFGRRNGYTGTINKTFGNPLAGRNGFVGRSFGYGASRANLKRLAGQRVKFRFRVGTQESEVLAFGPKGWFIDDVEIYSCRGSGGRQT